jgi:hypothetical protein
MRRVGVIAAALVLMLASAATGCGGSAGPASSPDTTTTPSAPPGAAALARHHQRRLEELGHMREAELVRGRAGWARNGLGVWWTADGGRHWRRVAPVLRSASLRLPGLKRCPARRVLTTVGVGCADARAVLRRFYGGGPLIDPGPSPTGWRCRQRETDHTSEGGDAYLVTCRSIAHPGRHFGCRWTSDI